MKRFAGKYIIISIFLVLLIKVTSCEPENWEIIDCNDCWSDKPDSANLIIQVTINSTYDSVPLTFYAGKIEDGVIDWQDTATTAEFYLYSKIGQTYSVKATYSSGNETIIAIDSDKMKIQNADDQCGYPCYVVKGGKFDLKLME